MRESRKRTERATLRSENLELWKNLKKEIKSSKWIYLYNLDALRHLQFTFKVVIFSNELVTFGGAVGDSVQGVVTALFVTFRIGLFSWKLFLVTTQNFKCYSEKEEVKGHFKYFSLLNLDFSFICEKTLWVCLHFCIRGFQTQFCNKSFLIFCCCLYNSHLHQIFSCLKLL